MYSFNTIPEAIEDIKNGKIIIVVDDEDRENEGDFIVSGVISCPLIFSMIVPAFTFERA